MFESIPSQTYSRRANKNKSKDWESFEFSKPISIFFSFYLFTLWGRQRCMKKKFKALYKLNLNNYPFLASIDDHFYFMRRYNTPLANDVSYAWILCSMIKLLVSFFIICFYWASGSKRKRVDCSGGINAPLTRTRKRVSSFCLPLLKCEETCVEKRDTHHVHLSGLSYL